MFSPYKILIGIGEPLFYWSVLLLLTVLGAGGFSSALAREIDPGPPRLKEVSRLADYVVIARCREGEPDPETRNLMTIHCSTAQQLKGEKDLENIRLRSFSPRSLAFSALTDGTPVLLFLKVDRSGEMNLVVRRGYVRLGEMSASAVESQKDYVGFSQITDVRKRFAASRQLMLDILDDPEDSWLKETAAEDLLEFARRSETSELIGSDVDAILDAAVKSRSAAVTDPLCLVMDTLGSDKMLEACLHSLFETDAPTKGSRVAPLIAKRPALFEGIVEEAQRTQEVERLRYILTLLNSVPSEQRFPVLKELWQSKPWARATIQRFVGFKGSDDQFAQYLTIQAMADESARVAASKSYFLDNLLGEDSYFKQHMAEQLQLLVHLHPDLRFTLGDVDLISQAVMETKSHLVAVPLCLVLEATKSDEVVEACRHSLFETDLLESTDSRLVGIVAKHESLVEALVEQAIITKEQDRLNLILLQLTGVPDDILLPAMERLWRANSVARPLIKANLGFAPSPAREDLLKKMATEE